MSVRITALCVGILLMPVWALAQGGGRTPTNPAAKPVPVAPCQEWGSIVFASLGGDERFVVLQRDDGSLRYVDLVAVDPRSVPTLTAGSLLAVTGLGGYRPHEVAATSLTPLRTVRGRLAAPGIGADATTLGIMGEDGRRYDVTMTSPTRGRRNITASSRLSVVGYSEGAPERLVAVHIEPIRDAFASSRHEPGGSEEASTQLDCGTTASRVVHAGPGSTGAGPLSTYYAYDPGSVRALRALPANARLTGADLDQQDTVMLGLVRRYKLPPTVASKLFAYVLTAQADVALLSRAAHGESVGSVGPVTTKILCLFFRSGCGSPEQDRTGDLYSDAVGRLVFRRVQERITEENAGTKPYVRRGGEPAWWAEWPVTPDAGSWRPWRIPDASQFRAPPPPVYG